ncbi:MAG: carboxypeptidase-like regulatory domain-containing protein, partial [Ferruginibacter sp.]
MKYIIALFFLIPFSLKAQQNYFTVSGRVISLPDSLPMQNASVFAENTTTGTVTDNNGNFKLVLPSGGYNIIVTFTGFSTEIQRVSSTSTMPVFFEMKVKEKNLDDVVIVSSNEVKDGWNKYGSFFLDEFLGKTLNRQNCNLLNPEVLKFYYSRKRKRLKILA